MTIKVSTGLRNSMLATGSFKSLMDGAVIKIYSGTPPVSADDAIGSAGTNNLLSTISVNGSGTGLTFDGSPSNGVMVKTAAELWRCTSNAASGTATFYRLSQPSDAGGSSASEPRVQGTVATAGADMNLSSVSLTSGAAQNIDYYSIALPAS